MRKDIYNQSAFTPLDKTAAGTRCCIFQQHLSCRSYLTGFTLIELLVTISIIALLMAIALPATSLARGVAKQMACKSNLRSIGWAFQNVSRR